MVNAFTASTVMANFEKEFCYMEKNHKSDGLFGTVTTWEEGVHFQAIERHDQTLEAQQAEQQGTAATYSLYVDPASKTEFSKVVTTTIFASWTAAILFLCWKSSVCC